MTTTRCPVAVIGMSCRFPSSDGVDAFWRNLVEGMECVGDVPPERWDIGRFAGNAPAMPGHTYCLQAGMDADMDCYDAAFFRLEPDETKRIDPQQGMALELAWHACEDAGITPSALVGTEVGVFIGVSTRDFDRRMANRWEHIDVQTSTGASGAIVANRVSYTFGFTGPSVAIDGACASSLASVHLACRAIVDGECEQALAGGVQLILSPANIIAFSQGGLLARDGRCKPFSAHADGYVCGEGGGMLLLKSLDCAMRDGDPIRAVILGSAINHNGRSNGLSAPFRAAQQRVMRAAIQRAEVPAASIGYIEAHAPGTLLGDAIELQAIRDVYDQERDDNSPCLVGSVKSNIGHLEAAAGIAAFIKTALAVEHGVLPPSLNCMPASSMLRLEKGSIRLSDALGAWSPSDRPRRAGVSAFSFGGGNAHAILEQPPSPSHARTAASPPWLMVVSAASEDALERLSRSYADHLTGLRDRGEPLAALQDVCATTLACRELLKHRRAWVVSDWDTAIEALRSPTSPGAATGLLRLSIPPADFGAASAWPLLEQRLAPIAAELRSSLRPLAFLSLLGLTRVGLALDPDTAARWAESAQPWRVTVVGDVMPLTRTPEVIFTDAEANHDWLPTNDARAQLLQLASELLQHGSSLRLTMLRELIGGGRTRIPLYPFERRRNHVVRDEIDPADVMADAVPASLLESIQ